MFFRYRKNLKKSTLVFIGTVPLASYQSLVTPSKQDYPTKDPAYGWNPVAPEGGEFPPKAPPPSAPQFTPSYSVTDNSPAEKLYPNLRKNNLFMQLKFN